LAKLMDAPGLVKHACDCIDSLAGLLQVLNLVMNSGVQMPKDLRKTLDMTLDLSLAQIKQQMSQPPPGPSGSTLIWLYLGVAQPHYQPFSVHDKGISYPYVPPDQQTVTVPMLFAVSIGVPVCVVVVLAAGIKRNMHDLHVGLLGLLMGVSLTLMFTNCLKNVLGRPRPNLLARCLPTPPTQPLDDPAQGLSTIAICTQPNRAVLDEGFRSFPSGHTSLAFAGMTFLMYYLAGKLHVFDRQGHTYKSFA
ncbi:hypothetical protein LPJ70_007108, partial [Coemansia sp. RSA 2708]